MLAGHLQHYPEIPPGVLNQCWALVYCSLMILHSDHSHHQEWMELVQVSPKLVMLPMWFHLAIPLMFFLRQHKANNKIYTHHILANSMIHIKITEFPWLLLYSWKLINNHITQIIRGENPHNRKWLTMAKPFC